MDDTASRRRRSGAWGRLAPFLALAVLLSLIHLAGGFGFLENQLMDLRFRLLRKEADGSAVVVAIDPRSLGALDVWPWPRGYHATVLENLTQVGAGRVAFDIDFSSRSELEEDSEFASVS